MGHVTKTLLGLVAASAVALTFTATAEAARCRGEHCKAARADEPGVYRYVHVEASTGGKRAFAPVRRGRFGDQVKLPNSKIWLDCELSCEYTLRRQTVDFWDHEGGRTAPVGYLNYEVDLTEGRVRRRFPH